MTTQISESFSWMSPEFTVKPTDKNTVKIKGVAVRKNTLSKNQRFYLDKTLDQGASSFIEEPITENHKPWQEKKNQIGKVNWMAYDADGCMEYVAEVWNPAMVAELRLYAQDPSKSKVRGVSIEADYLYDVCPICKQRFTDNNLFQKHMAETEFKPMTAAPAQMKGRALSIVTSPETPGVPNATLTVMETQNGLSRLLETITQTVTEEEKYMSKIGISPRPNYAVGPVSNFKESEAPEKPNPPAKVSTCKECGKPLNEAGECVNKECKECHPSVKEEKACPECGKPMKEGKCVNPDCSPSSPTDTTKTEHVKEKITAPKITVETKPEVAKTVTVKEALNLPKLSAPKLTEPKFTITEVESGKAAERINEQKQLLESFTAICSQINSIQEYLSQPFTVTADDLTWKQQLSGLTESTNQALQTLTVAVNGIPVYNDKSLREQFLAKIEETRNSFVPFNDSALKTELAALRETVNTQATKLTEQETINKQLTEKYTQQSEINKQETQNLKAELTKLTETVATQKTEWDATIKLADQNNGKLREQLDDTKKLLETQRHDSEKQIRELKETAEKAKTLAENEREHRQSSFKAHNKQLTETNNQPITEDPLKKKEKS